MRWRHVLLLLVILCGCGALMLELAARSAARQIAARIEPFASLSYASAGVSLNGGVELRDVRIHLKESSWPARLRANRVVLRGGSLAWLPGLLLGIEPPVPTRLDAVIDGLAPDRGDAAIVAGDWLGIPDLALFENLGCGDDPLIDKDRIRMGVPAHAREDRIGYRFDPESRTLELEFDLQSAGVSRWSGSMNWSGVEPDRWGSDATQADLRLRKLTLSYQDPGYLTKRNRFCATWNGISTDAFIDQHVAAVRRFLDSHGIQPSAEVLSLYQRLVSRGGALNLASLPEADWMPSAIESYPRQVLLRQLNVTARLENAPPIMLDLKFSEPEEPLYVVHGSALSDDEEPLDHSDSGHAEPDMADAPPPPPRDTEPATAVPASAEPEPESQVASQPEAQAPAEPPGLDEHPDARSLGASAPPPPPGSTLALVWEPGKIQRLKPAENPAPSRYVQVPGSALGAYIGKRVRLVTSSGRSVDGKLVSVADGEVVVLIAVGRGEAELSLPLERIREARVGRGAG